MKCFILMVFILSGCSNIEPNKKEDTSRTVTYYVSTGGTALICYADIDGINHTLYHVTTPWSITFSAQEGDWVMLIASDYSDIGVIAKIIVDDSVWKQSFGTTNTLGLSGALP
jgi:uncharacterized protein YceK